MEKCRFLLYLSFFVGQKLRVFHKCVQLSVRFVATVHTSDVLYCAVVKSKDYSLTYLLLCIFLGCFCKINGFDIFLVGFQHTNN